MLKKNAVPTLNLPKSKVLTASQINRNQRMAEKQATANSLEQKALSAFLDVGAMEIVNSENIPEGSSGK